MAKTGAGLIGGSRWVVVAALMVNRVFLGAVVLGWVLSWVLRERFAAMLLGSHPGVDVRAEMAGLRWEMVLGLAMAVGAEVLLRALGEMVASAGTGDPFAAANATRLRSIGWSLLGLQLLDVPAAMLVRFYPSLGTAAPEVGFSPGGWLAVLMVFVLSRVFAAGSAMRDDLEGTV